SVNDRGIRISLKIDRNQRLFAESEYALQLSFGRIFKCAIYLVGGGLFFNIHHDVDQRHVGRRHADGNTVEFTFQLRDDERDRLCGTCRGRDHRECRRACTAQVLRSEERRVGKECSSRGGRERDRKGGQQ